MKSQRKSGWIAMPGASPIQCSFVITRDGRVTIQLAQQIRLTTEFQLMSDGDILLCRRSFQNERLATAEIASTGANPSQRAIRSRMIGTSLRSVNS